jgi:lipopolysaccharide/colanic/teichoic acid biosynthesis glycosyltransferase
MAKRLMDIAVAGIALAVLSPVLLVLIVLVKLSSPGPVFYFGERVGRNGVPFRIAKFRSMVVGADRIGGSATANDDPRLTPIGRFLRRYKLDELPQFWNVLKGEMSLVGPRPEVRKFVDRYGPEERRVLALRPGITDWASIWNCDEGSVLAGSRDPEETYSELILPGKLRLQLLYLEDHSVRTDCKILFHTALRLFGVDSVPAELRAFPKPGAAPPVVHSLTRGIPS